MKYVYFEDLHGDDMDKLVLIDNAEFDKLQPYRSDMENCDPLPDELQTLVWDDMFMRTEDELGINDIPYDDCLLQRIA
jgi:hypothetical protein